MKNRIIDVQNVKITISKEELDDYICITDIAKAKSNSARAADVVRNWLRNRGTLEYLSVWERIYNPACFLKCSNLNTLKSKRDY